MKWIEQLKDISGALLAVVTLLAATAYLTHWLTKRNFTGQIKILNEHLKWEEKKRAEWKQKVNELTKARDRQKEKKAAARLKWKDARTPKETDSALVDLEAANDTSAEVEVDAALDELKEASDSVEEAPTAEP